RAESDCKRKRASSSFAIFKSRKIPEKRMHIMRTIIIWIGLRLLLVVGVPSHAEDKEKPARTKKPKKRLLVITESRGFQHGCVKRNGDELCLVEKILTKLGKDSGDFEAVCSQESRKVITAENLKKFDAVFFYTTGTLPLSDTQKADLLKFIRS